MKNDNFDIFSYNVAVESSTENKILWKKYDE